MKNTDNDFLLKTRCHEPTHVQISLDLGIDFGVKRELLKDGRPTGGQRYRDACSQGFKGNFLDYLKLEGLEEARVGTELGFLCGADYFVAKTFGMNKEEYYSKYMSCLHIPQRLPDNYVYQENQEIEKPKRKWSDEAIYRNRINRLKKRIAKKYSIPIMYEQALNEAVKEKPEYFGVSASG